MIETAPQPTTEPSVEPEQRQRAVSPLYPLALIGVLVGSAALRTWGLGFGLPHLYHWDEKMYSHGAFYTLATGGSTESLVYGNVPYLLVPLYWVISLYRGIPPGASGLPELIKTYLADPTPFYMAGRLVWVALQLAAVWVCYVVGARALSRRAGLLASAFLGAAFLFVSEGHYVKGDTTALLGALFAAWAALWLVSNPTWPRYFWLGAAIGLSIAFKFYTYPLVLAAPITHLFAWHDLKSRLSRWWLLAVSALGALFAFFATLPAFLVDPSGTWQTFQTESAITLASVPTGGQPIWLYYWTGHLLEGTGWPLELAGLGGFVLWAMRRDRSRLLLLSFPLLLWLGIVSRSNGFARYALPIVPFLCLAAGDLVDFAAAYLAARLSAARRALVPSALVLIAGLLILPSLLNDLRFDAYTAAPDTRTLAARWVEANLPAGASIVEEGGQGFEAMSTLGPPLRASASSAGQTWAPTFLKPPVDYWSQPLLQWLDAYTPTYRITFAATLTRRKDITTTAGWGNPDAFVIMSWRSDPERGLPTSPFWDDLNKNYMQAARFDCSPCFPDDPYAWAVDYGTLSAVRPFSGGVVAGPRIWVYTRK